MTNCSAFSSLLNISGSKMTKPDVGFSKIKLLLEKKHSFPRFCPKKSAPIADNYNSSSGSCNLATISNSVTLDFDSANDEELKAESKLGSKVRVTVPLTVYHVPKLPEFELTDKVGALKQYVGVYKGKRISANLPYKVVFETDQVLGRDGKPVKFTAHLREDEFEFLE